MTEQAKGLVQQLLNKSHADLTPAIQAIALKDLASIAKPFATMLGDAKTFDVTQRRIAPALRWRTMFGKTAYSLLPPTCARRRCCRNLAFLPAAWRAARQIGIASAKRLTH